MIDQGETTKYLVQSDSKRHDNFLWVQENLEGSTGTMEKQQKVFVGMQHEILQLISPSATDDF